MICAVFVELERITNAAATVAYCFTGKRETKEKEKRKRKRGKTFFLSLLVIDRSANSIKIRARFLFQSRRVAESIF